MTGTIFICGDSHSSMLARYARDAGIDFIGGPIGNGILLEDYFFRIGKDRRLELVPDGLRPRQKIFEALPTHEGPILSTVGFNSHRISNALSTYLKDTDTRLNEISDAAWAATIHRMRRGSLHFYKALCNRGRNVYFTTSPQLCASADQLPVLQRFENVMIETISSYGGKLVDVRDDIMEDGKVAERFIHDESKVPIHGNDAWSELVFARLAELQRQPDTAAAQG